MALRLIPSGIKMRFFISAGASNVMPSKGEVWILSWLHGQHACAERKTCAHVDTKKRGRTLHLIPFGIKMRLRISAWGLECNAAMGTV